MLAFYSNLASIWLFTSLANAVNFDCKNIQIQKTKFNLEKLGGPHSILVEDTLAHPSKSNTTWTIDICQALKKPADTPRGDACPAYTRVCGVTKSWNPVDDPNVEHPIISDVIGVAGEYKLSHGGALEPNITRLKTSDKEGEGLEVELHGGRYNDRKQKAVITFLCDADKTGNEGFEENDSQFSRREEDDDDDNGDEGKERFRQDSKNALQFLSYQSEGEGKERMDVLRLDWRTKYACESSTGDDNDNDSRDPSNSGWGFFTWFILILFLVIAAYLIFGSWLNYNRYGARGWDLLPHGDTIRDIPYLFKDWSRKVVETVTGSTSRGGYSAV